MKNFLEHDTKYDPDKNYVRLRFMIWVILVGVVALEWLNGGSIREVGYRAFMGILVFTFIGTILSDLSE